MADYTTELQKIRRQGIYIHKIDVDSNRAMQLAYNAHKVDLNNRVVESPKWIGVSQDNDSNTVYFVVDRYFGTKDLATTSCLIEYQTALGNTYIYPVPFYDIDTYKYQLEKTKNGIYRQKFEDNDPNKLIQVDKIIIPWYIQNQVTEASGYVKFALRFFDVSAGGTILYDLNTLPATSRVLQGLNEDLNDIDYNKLILDSSFLINLNKINQANNNMVLYWGDASQILNED